MARKIQYDIVILPNRVLAFSVRKLANALGRSRWTVKLWEAQGYFPATPLRRPGDNGRLYTQGMIDVAVREWDRMGRVMVKGPRAVEFGQAIARGWLEVMERLLTGPRDIRTVRRMYARFGQDGDV